MRAHRARPSRSSVRPDERPARSRGRAERRDPAAAAAGRRRAGPERRGDGRPRDAARHRPRRPDGRRRRGRSGSSRPTSASSRRRRPGETSTRSRATAMAFRRSDYVERGPLDEHFRFYRNLDIWWSLVLRDDGDGTTLRGGRVARARPARSSATSTAAGRSLRDGRARPPLEAELLPDPRPLRRRGGTSWLEPRLGPSDPPPGRLAVRSVGRPPGPVAELVAERVGRRKVARRAGLGPARHERRHLRPGGRPRSVAAVAAQTRSRSSPRTSRRRARASAARPR